MNRIASLTHRLAGRSLATLLLLAVATGCAATQPPAVTKTDSGVYIPHRDTVLSRDLRVFARLFAYNGPGLDRSTDAFFHSLESDAKATRDHVVGAPGALADEFSGGVRRAAHTVGDIGRGIADDVRTLPEDTRRFFWALW